ncbi:MAG: nucleoside-diphosphate kinase [Chloroflexota bacterium]|nr:nucleoside-diphosphate kinase [Chloroflexota bacterium]MDP6507539.1 nucleoside-diphosphate kinase [Chloroflexota bacterium]MDP6757273.1 nucleoside-diphosphate kinase [Chloroflexota bacterium]
MEKTFVLLKPDALQRGLVGEILARFDRRGYRFLALKLLQTTEAQAAEHYGVHKGKFFYEDLVKHLTSGPVIAMVLEGSEAIAAVRKMVGATRPPEAEAGTIRGDFGQAGLRNLVHASDAPETAAAEMAIYFDESEFVASERAIDRWIFEDGE